MATWEIFLHDDHPLAAIRRSADGQVLERVDRPMTVLDLARRTRRSRRQVYRDLRSGRIRPLGKFLGEWLVDPRELARLWPPPRSLASLLPEYNLDSLDLDRHGDLVLSRILRFGGRDRLRWAFRFYGEPRIRRFVVREGAKRLDPRSQRFWTLLLGVRARSAPGGRLRGRQWGGA